MFLGWCLLDITNLRAFVRVCVMWQSCCICAPMWLLGASSVLKLLNATVCLQSWVLSYSDRKIHRAERTAISDFVTISDGGGAALALICYAVKWAKKTKIAFSLHCLKNHTFFFTAASCQCLWLKLIVSRKQCHQSFDWKTWPGSSPLETSFAYRLHHNCPSAM